MITIMMRKSIATIGVAGTIMDIPAEIPMSVPYFSILFFHSISDVTTSHALSSSLSWLLSWLLSLGTETDSDIDINADTGRMVSMLKRSRISCTDRGAKEEVEEEKEDKEKEEDEDVEGHFPPTLPYSLALSSQSEQWSERVSHFVKFLPDFEQ